jgi:hypothetical protein
MNHLRITLAALLACAAVFFFHGAVADPRAAQVAGQEPGPPTPPDIWLRRLVGKYRFEGMIQAIERGDCAPLPPDPAKQDQMSEAPPEPYCRTIKGTGDCIAVGKGPGVQCVLNVFWQDMYEMVLQKSEADATSVDASPTGVFELPGGVAYLDPSMMLFGIDPGNSAIEYLLVDNKGRPEGGPGHVAGNRATFRTKCVNEAALLNAMKPVNVNDRKPDTCERKLYFDAKPDSKVVLVTMQIDINEKMFTQATITMRRQQPEETTTPASAPPPALAPPPGPQNRGSDNPGRRPVF